MKNFKFLFVFTAVAFVFASCNDDEGGEVTNSIEIDIHEPMNDEVIAFTDCGDVHVHVDFIASVENHEVKVVLHPEGDTSDKIIDYDEHDHDKTVTFEQDLDLCSYGAGACFHLEVEACVDHDCAEKTTADVEFCLQ